MVILIDRVGRLRGRQYVLGRWWHHQFIFTSVSVLAEHLNETGFKGKTTYNIPIFHVSSHVFSDFSVRLVGGNHSCSGRVEIYHNSSWGTVCDDSWDMNDAQVVCRQLGCGSALSTPGSATYGQGEGSILLDEVSCSGNESSLSECFHDGVGIHDCRHSEDVGVVCEGKCMTK